ncbi:MAG: hypothetical protein F4057_10375, partial [Acidobacteria bacterium]|nr:hypothetical protein [Acidobacteriota bacterium]
MRSRLAEPAPAAVLAVAAVFILLAGPPPAGAHPLEFTAATLTLQPDGTFEANLVCDLDALALGAPLDSDDAELVAALEGLSGEEFDTLVARLRRMFERRVRV